MNVLFPPCRLCAEAHPELSCTKYRTPDERQSRVRSLNRCTQCLDATDLDHVGLCPNDRRCLKCSGAHHEALCAVQFTAPLGTSQSGTSGASSTTALPSFRFITSKTSVQPPVAPFEFTLSPVKPKFHPDPSIPQPNSKTEEKDATCASPISSVSNAPETGSKDNTGTMASSGDLFEQNKPSLFGSSQQNAFSTTTPSTGLFRSGIAGAQGARTGTTIKFDAPRDKDTIMQNKEMQWIDTRHVCITAMREYDGKSFEELRMEDNLDHRKSGTAGGTSLVRSQQAAPTLGSTAGATGGGGLCGGLSQNTPRLVSDPSAKTARPVVSCASSSSSPSSSKTPDVIARAVQQPAGNPTKREGPAASSEQSKKAATTSCEAPKASTRNGANAIPTLASLMNQCSTLRAAEDSGKKLQSGTQHSQPPVKAHLPAPLCPCVFCAGWHWPEECWRFPRASQRRGILRRNGCCVRCMRVLWPHHGTYCHEVFLPCRGCGKTNHHFAVCLTAFGTSVSRPPPTVNQPTTAAKSAAATERTPRTTKDSVVSSSAATITVPPPTHKATVKPPTVPSGLLTQTSSPASNKVNTPQNSKQEHASSKSQVHTRSTLWKTPEAPCAPSEQAVKADAVVNALPTATLTAEVIQTRKASCLAAEAVVPSVVTNSVSMKLPAVRSTTTSTLCAASAGALSPTSEVSAQVSTSAGTGSTRHTSDPSATIGIHCNGRKRKAEDNARLDNDGQTEMRTPSASTGDKSEKISQLQNAPSSGTGADKLADSSEARKGATSTSQDRPKQAPKRIKPTTTGTNNHPEVPARVVPSVKLRDTASKRQPSGDSSALTRAQHSASAMSDKQADPSEAMKGATSETPSHCPKDAYEEPPRVTPQTNGRIQAHSANVSEPTNISRAISYGCTPLSAAVRSTVAPKGRSSERPSVSGYKPKAAASLVNASVENGDSGVSKPPDGSVTNTPPLAGSSTDWAARFNDVARRAREDAQKTLAEGLQKLFEQTQILETEAEEIFEVERRRLDDEREKLTEMKADISKRRQAIKIKEMKLSTKERRLRDMEQKLNADQRSVDAAREDLVIDRLNMEEERRERIDALPNYEQHVQNERILAEYRLQLEAKEARLQQRAQELEGVFVDLQQQKAAFEEDKLQQASASKSRSRSPHSSSRRSSGHVVKSEAVSSSSRRYSSLRDAEEEICRLKRRLKSARDDVDDAHRELRCIKEKRGDESPRRRDAIDESLRKQLDEAKQKHRAQEEALSRAKSERCAAEMKADVAEKTLAEQKAAHTEKVEGLTTEIEILRWSLEFRRQRSERKIKEAKARKQHQMRQKRGVPAMSATTKSGTVASARVRIKPEVCDDGYGDASRATGNAAPCSANGPGTVPANGQSSDQTVLSTITRRKLELTTRFPAKLVDRYLAFLDANVTTAVHVRELIEFLKQKDPENLTLSEAIIGMCDEALEDHTV